MKSLIVLSCLTLSTLALPTHHEPQVYHVGHYYHGPPAPLAHDGRVVDTPEVAHAKKVHFAAYAEAAAKAAPPHVGYYAGGGHDGGFAGGFDGGFDGGYPAGGSYIGYAGGHHDGYQSKYHGPPAPLGKDGRVVDTPEVAHAKIAHLSAHAEELAKHLPYAYSYPHFS
ncbi:cuticle protein 2 [Temnothorax nylanderi]|uniref:cuticle protein 2 n=1 Tax=Temnothorax nylanderi TaxID=102681 RepID=UPI003A8978DF